MPSRQERGQHVVYKTSKNSRTRQNPQSMTLEEIKHALPAITHLLLPSPQNIITNFQNMIRYYTSNAGRHASEIVAPPSPLLLWSPGSNGMCYAFPECPMNGAQRRRYAVMHMVCKGGTDAHHYRSSRLHWFSSGWTARVNGL